MNKRGCNIKTIIEELKIIFCQNMSYISWLATKF